MNTGFIKAVAIALIICATGCKKAPEEVFSGTSIDSIEIHRVGGFAGFDDHFIITPSDIRRDDTKPRPDNRYIFNVPLPAQKHNLVISILKDVPSEMMTAPNPTTGDPTQSDALGEWVVLYKNGQSHELSIGNFPSSAGAYRSRIQKALETLTQ